MTFFGQKVLILLIIINFNLFVFCNQNFPVVEGKTLTISTVLYTDDISPLNNKDMDFRLDYYLKHQWNVSHLFCQHYSKELIKAKIILDSSEKTAVLTKEDIKLFWTPDTILTNAKSVVKPSNIIDTHVLKIKNLTETGICFLEYLEKMSAIVNCPMDFHHYPREKIICRLDFRSYSNDLRKVVYKWNIKAWYKNPILSLLQHSLEIQSNQTNKTNLEGNFSIVQVTFIFRSQIINKLTQVYLPSVVVVGMSWLSFWISLNTKGTGRVTLCLLCLLAISSQFVSARKELPQLSYITLIDVWMLGCLVFIFGTLCELTLVRYLKINYENNLETNKRKKLKLLFEERESVNPIKITDFRPTLTSIEYSLVPGYKTYLENILHRQMKCGFPQNKISFINLKQNYSSDEGIHTNERLSVQSKTVTNEIGNTNEVIWFKQIDKISRFLFPIGFGVFLVIYSSILINLD